MTDNVLDMAALKRLLEVIGGDPEDLDELKEEFYDTAPAIVEAMQAGLVKGDFEALRISSHSLKGNARDFGATHLADLCHTLEQKCKDGAPFDASGLVSDIVAAETAARTALKALQASDLV